MKKILFSILISLISLTGCPSCGYSWNCNNYEGMRRYYHKDFSCLDNQMKIATKDVPYSKDLHGYIFNNCIESKGKYKWTDDHLRNYHRHEPSNQEILQ